MIFCCFSIVASANESESRKPMIFCGSKSNDLYQLLQDDGFVLKHYGTAAEGIKAAVKGAAIIVLADGYPATGTTMTDAELSEAKRKRLKVYIEYPSQLPGLHINPKAINTQLERGVVTTDAFGGNLKPLTILGINDCYVYPVAVGNPMLVLAKVAGFDKAEYGIDDVEKHPLLFKKDNLIIAMTKLSNFATGRYGPNDAWKRVWTYIMKELTGNTSIKFTKWPSYVSPMYSKDESLPDNAKSISIEKGVQWFYNGRFFVHPSWKDMVYKYQGDGTNPIAQPLSQDLPNGDGSEGLLEGHASKVYHDGKQQYRYWLRADVQGEGAYALASAGKFLGKQEYNDKAEKLIDYIFKNSNLRAEGRNDKSSPSYGLIGWSVTHPHVFYGDDNARAILGILGASALMGKDKWDKEMLEGILANFRTTGKYGFRGERQEEKDLYKMGWQHFQDRDVVHMAPHFEAWMWALYLWLYEKTGYEPLLEKTKTAIKMTMDGYPDKWVWTNGIQQERARMVLPLAWLVRVEDTAEHRKWLDIIVQKLLENQVESGAIREELGAGKGRFGRTRSNKEYGLHEAPLIFTNGDPIADMLYTSNFAFFTLNEAAHATGNKQYKEAVAKLSDFLTRIQVKSDRYKDLDGAWFRAFEYDRWEYWASNADSGWGAWGTLTGWTQSWIVATQVLNVQGQNFWDLTKNSGVGKNFTAVAKTLDIKK